MSIDPLEFRRALGCFATGVTVVTALPPPRRPVGITVNSFASVSLDPPLVLWCLDRTSERFSAFEQADHFAVNVLSEEQAELSAMFASYDHEDFPAVETEAWVTGAPILTGALASLDCRLEKRVEAGDHVIYLGRVLALRVRRDDAPLIFFRGKYRGLGTV